MFSTDDVIYLVRKVGITLVQQTILAPMSGAVCNEAAKFARNITGQTACADGLVPWPE